MNYKEKYNEALERARALNDGKDVDIEAGTTPCEYIFPELKESEDVVHRNWILEYLYDGLRKADEQFRPQFESAITWLEKQAESNPYSDVTFNYNGHTWGMCVRDNGVDILLDKQLFKHLEKQDEQTTDKVEPKFKVGDWVILNGVVAKILDKQKYGFVGLDIDGKDFFCNYGHTDSMRLWTINDAKNGDVLAYVTDEEDLWIMIYQSLYKPYEGHVHYHALLVNDNFSDKGTCCICIDNLKPATKEQRELLFSKMKQAGYEWDDENKKLWLLKQTLKITPKFCVGQVITDDNGTWYKITNIKCSDDWYYELYDVGKANTHLELCSIIDEKFRENRFVGEIKKMMGD